MYGSFVIGTAKYPSCIWVIRADANYYLPATVRKTWEWQFLPSQPPLVLMCQCPTSALVFPPVIPGNKLAVVENHSAALRGIVSLLPWRVHDSFHALHHFLCIPIEEGEPHQKTSDRLFFFLAFNCPLATQKLVTDIGCKIFYWSK